MFDQTDELKYVLKTHDPACGNNQLVEALADCNIDCSFSDINKDGIDFLTDFTNRPSIITNPPFSLFDDFIHHAKIVSPLVMFIGKLNFLGCYSRSRNSTWKHLRSIYVFNRMADYRTKHRDDGYFNVGNIVTGWFIWDRNWTKPYWKQAILDVQEYATLGAYKEDSNGNKCASE